MKPRYFFDMDGTMAVWNNVSNEELYKENYFLNLDTNDYMIALVNQLIREGKEVYSCSHFLTDSQYALEEKNKWLDKYIPSLDKDHRVFIPYGQSKAEYFNKHGLIPIITTDFLIDDYTPNLLQWEELGGTGIKFLNGINHTHGTWQGIKINNRSNIYIEMSLGIADILSNKIKPIYDMAQWGVDGIFSARPGQQITQEIYEHMLNCMPPLYLPDNESGITVSAGFMMGEPYDHKNGQNIFLAFGKNQQGYYYLGHMDMNGKLYDLEYEQEIKIKESLEEQENEDDLELE